jgi:hypothetical protein
VLELGEFDLELAFVAARTLREDVEDQAGAVQHAPLDELLEVAFLRGRQRVIEQHQFGVVFVGDGADLVGLAAADEEARVRPVTTAAHAGHRMAPRERASCSNSRVSSGSAGAPSPRAHEHGPFTCAGSLEHF